VAVDFSAEPSPEGLELAARLRRERRQRDKAAEDRLAAAEEQALLDEGRVSEIPSASRVATESDTEDDDVDRDRPDEPRRPTPSVPNERIVEPVAGPSIQARLDELAAVSHAMSRKRTADRQR
jgi:hypothetical protein